MTIWRGPGGTGSASSEVDTTQFQEFLVQSQAARDAALAAQVAAELAETNAETAETNAETAETNAETAATNAASSASNAATSASYAASSATSAANSASAAAASAASINPADIVHISGTETITGAKTFSSNPVLLAGTANGVAYLNGSKVLTSGSALTFDGTNLGVGTSLPGVRLDVVGPSGSGTQLTVSDGANQGLIRISKSANLYGIAAGNDFGGLVFYSNNATERARIDSSGNLLVGTTSNAATGGIAVLPNSSNSLIRIGHVAGSGSTSYFLDFYYNGGQIGSIQQSGTTGVSYLTSSDYRLKENVQPMTGALARVAALKPVTYTWKADGSAGEGFIAHELQEVCPSAVGGEKDAVETYTDEDGVEQTRPVYQGIDTSFLVATLTAAIQEQQAIITAQAAQIQQLREKVLEVEEGTSNMLVENTNNLYEAITALTARVAALEAA